MSISIVLDEKDLSLIGFDSKKNGEMYKNTEFGENGTKFILNKHAFGIEYVILKSIIKSFGYKVSDIKENDKYEIYANTSYPWKKMCEFKYPTNECNDA